MKIIVSYSFFLKLLFLVTVLLCSIALVRADEYAFKDSVALEEVTIVREAKRFQAGAKIIYLNNEHIASVNDESLENVLKQYTAIPIKSNAGSLSTIRLRGTSPNHTSVNVGGINLNSLTLGSSNLANIPAYFFEELMIQYGSASVVNGSGSIGGSLNLSSKLKWVDGVSVNGKMSFGSFGKQFYGAKVYAGNGKFESVTKLYYLYKKNNFTFLHPPVKNFETGEFIRVKDTQHNAAINNKGVMQEFGYRFGTQKYWRFMIWLEDDWHQIQQNMATNLNQPWKKEELEDKHIRIWSYYKNNSKKLKKYIGAGYVFDNCIYNNSDDPIQTKRFISEGNIEYAVYKNGMLKAGFKSEVISPNVYAYEINDVLQYQTDLYTSYLHTFFSKLKVSLNLRKGFVTDFTVPFTPALGLSYPVMIKEDSRMELKGNVAKSYRVPTFNDRFWVPGGNPDLNPENGISYELGGKYSLYKNKVRVNVLLNTFYMDVEDWILWKNSGAYWTAENVQNVVSMGVELQTNVKIKFNRSDILFGLNYTFNSAERTESRNITAAIDRQLEYVPYHTVALYSRYKLRALTFYVNVNGVSWQYTNEEPYNILDGYVLTDVSVDNIFIINKKHKLKAALYANNIFNVNYYASWNYAMPRRNIGAGVSYFFN
ncbi:MAG: TonB-dependent receptor [Chlorobi bacterium]|nr:TonB-dependent receptor [Chlorobiota bacterium]